MDAQVAESRASLVDIQTQALNATTTLSREAAELESLVVALKAESVTLQDTVNNELFELSQAKDQAENDVALIKAQAEAEVAVLKASF